MTCLKGNRVTTLYPQNLKCAICGAVAEYTQIGSTSTFGSPDLDTRPPEMRRSTMFAWVRRCPECGYCASDIGQATHRAAALVRSPEYARQLADATYPELANSFMCKALIEEQSEDLAAAAWSLIHAAWACDDAERDGPARACRSKAVDMVGKALDSGQRIADQEGAQTAIQVDLLRRAGRLDEASELIWRQRPGIGEDIILKVLAFQERLIERGDLSCHTIAEALADD